MDPHQTQPDMGDNLHLTGSSECISVPNGLQTKEDPEVQNNIIKQK